VRGVEKFDPQPAELQVSPPIALLADCARGITPAIAEKKPHDPAADPHAPKNRSNKLQEKGQRELSQELGRTPSRERALAWRWRLPEEEVKAFSAGAATG